MKIKNIKTSFIQVNHPNYLYLHMKWFILATVILLLIAPTASADVVFNDWKNSTMINTTLVENKTIYGADSGDFFNRPSGTNISANTTKNQWFQSSSIYVKIGTNNLTIAATGHYALDKDSYGSGGIICSQISTSTGDPSFYFLMQSSGSNSNGYEMRFLTTSVQWRYMPGATSIGTLSSITWTNGDFVCVDYRNSATSGIVLYKNGLLWGNISSTNNSYTSGYSGLGAISSSPAYFDNYSVTRTFTGTSTIPVQNSTGGQVFRGIKVNASIPDGAILSTYVNSTECNGFTLSTSQMVNNTEYTLPSCAQKSNTIPRFGFTSLVNGSKPFIYDTTMIEASYATIPPQVLINSPVNGSSNSKTIVFNITSNDNYGLLNLTLYDNSSGWASIATRNLSGTTNTTTIEKTYSTDGNYLWSVQVYDNNSNVVWSNNHTININSTSPTLNITSTVNISTNRSYYNITITSNKSLISATLNWNGTNETMSGSGTDWYREKTFIPSSNYTFNVTVSDSFGNTNTSRTVWRNITKKKIIFDPSNISDVYGWKNNASTPWSTWESTIMSSANTGITYDYTVNTWSGSLDDRASHTVTMATAFNIKRTSTYLKKTEEALMNLDVYNGTPSYDAIYGAAVMNYGLGYYWTEGGINDINSTIIRSKLGVLANFTFYRLNASGSNTVQFVDTHGRMYPPMGVIGIVLDGYNNASLSTQPDNWKKVGTDYLFSNDVLHSYNRPLVGFGYDDKGMMLNGGYRAYVSNEFVTWASAYSSYYSNIYDIYPITKNIPLSLIYQNLPNNYTSNFIVLGQLIWKEELYGAVSLMDDTNKSYIIERLESLARDTPLPYATEATSNSYANPIISVTDYMTYNNYTSLTRRTPNITSLLNDNGTNITYNVFRSGWGHNSSWLSFITFNVDSTSNRDLQHHDQMSVEWYDRGDLLLSDAGEPKYFFQPTYGEYESHHNELAIEDPRTPFTPSVITNSTSRAFYKGGATTTIELYPILTKIQQTQIELMKSNINPAKVTGPTQATSTSLSSSVIWNRTVIFPKDYFVIIDSAKGVESWSWRNIWRPSSLNTTPTTDITTLSGIGHVNLTLRIDNLEYNWTSWKNPTEISSGGTSENTTNVITSNISWNTSNPYGVLVFASLYTVPASQVITNKLVTRIGGSTSASPNPDEVFLPVVSFRQNGTNMNRITIIQSNFTDETPRTTMNVSTDANHSGLIITNSTTRDIVTAFNSTNGTMSNVTTNAEVSFSRNESNLAYFSAINVSYFKYDDNEWLASNKTLSSVFLNVSGPNRTIIAEGISTTKAIVLVNSSSNYNVHKNDINFTDWFIADSTHIAINMTFESPSTYQILEVLPSGGETVNYMPPSPINLANTTGSYWINHTWQAGAGNVTNSYNISVNGTWSNGTTNTYYNNSNLLPNGWSNITVQSYNSSGNGTLNLTAISMNTQTPFVPVSVTVSCPVGWCYLAMNYTNKTLLQLDNMFLTDIVQGQFNSTSQKYETHVTGFSPNRNSNVTKKKGYYYYFLSSTPVSLNITDVPSITLNTGWNLVGNMLTNRTLSQLKESIGSSAIQAQHFNKTTQTFKTLNSETVPIGEGFFVYVTSNITWDN